MEILSRKFCLWSRIWALFIVQGLVADISSATRNNVSSIFEDAFWEEGAPPQNTEDILMRKLSHQAHEKREFLVVSQPRSGTTFLSQAFNAHPCMNSVGEENGGVLQLDIEKGTGHYFQRALPKLRSSTACPVFYYGGKQFLAEINGNNIATSSETSIRVQSAREVGLLGQFLKRYPKIHVILMLRRNLMDYFIPRGTHIYGENKLTQHCREKKCRSSVSQRAKVDLDALGRFVQDQHTLQTQALAAFQQIALELGVKVLYVPYELVAEDNVAALSGILEFLGLPPPINGLQSLVKVKKMLDLPRDGLLTNWETVRTVLQAGPEWCDQWKADCALYAEAGLAGLPLQRRRMGVLPDPKID